MDFENRVMKKIYESIVPLPEKLKAEWRILQNCITKISEP
jgi:hypothetical protein